MAGKEEQLSGGLYGCLPSPSDGRRVGWVTDGAIFFSCEKKKKTQVEDFLLSLYSQEAWVVVIEV